jgi:hypothetical protein
MLKAVPSIRKRKSFTYEKLKLSPQQAMEAYTVVGLGSHIV